MRRYEPANYSIICSIVTLHFSPQDHIRALRTGVCGMGAEEPGHHMKCILITGAAGQIGVALRSGLRGQYPVLRLLDVAPLGEAAAGEEIVRADIRDIGAMEKAVQ